MPEKAVWNIKLQIILHQLHNLYSDRPDNWNKGHVENIYGFRAEYSELYDFLVSIGHKVEFSKEDKARLWELAKKKFNLEKKDWIQSPKYWIGMEQFKDEVLKKELNKYYKSYLVRKYLLDKFDTEGVLILQDEEGNKLLRMDIA